MNKRSTKILIGCVLCTLIVLALFLIIFTSTRLSCELVSLDPVQLASSQLSAFSKVSKPVRSHDETILMKISAYLEYNIQPDTNEMPSTGSSKSAGLRGDDLIAPIHSNGGTNFTTTTTTTTTNNNNNLTAGNTFGQQPPINPPPPGVSPSSSSSSSSNGVRPFQGPAPSVPQINFPVAQQNSTVANLNQQNHWNSGQAQLASHHKAEKRFLPLELRSIETRNLMDGAKHKYILNFNCTKINLILVHQNNRVYVESMNLELRPASRLETTCEVQLPSTGAFMVADSIGYNQQQQQQGQAGQVSNVGSGIFATPNGNVTNSGVLNQDNNHNKHHSSSHSSKEKDYSHFAHYYCNKPLRYSCYHYNPKSGPSQSNGLLLAELHINGIEFETSTSWTGKHKKVKSEFKSKRSECNIV